MQKMSHVYFETSNGAANQMGCNHNPARLPLHVAMRRPADLKEHEGHSRRHSHQQIRKIAHSIETFGFVAPVLVDSNGVIIAGHALAAAAKRLELAEIPVIEISHLSEAEVKALRLALNRLAEDARWDEHLLRLEIETLIIDAPEIEITSTGFAMAEIDRLLILPGSGDEAPLPALPDTPVSRPGDLWQLGPHRLLCGDALLPESYETLLGEEKVQLVVADPPYNVRIAGHVRGKGRVQHDEFVMASGEMDEAAFTRFLETFMTHAARHSLDGALHLLCMDWRHMTEILAAGRSAYGTGPLNLIIWAKENAGQGSLYRSRHELIFLFKVGSAAHVNNIELGKHGRYRSNVWTYPGVNSFGKGRDRALADHPTVKPLAMVVDAILDLSNRHDLVLDPFGGSGTTLLAAHDTGRGARLIELDPRYVDVTIRRWREQTGEPAIELRSGQSFEAICEIRERELAAVPGTTSPSTSIRDALKNSPQDTFDGSL